MVRRRGEQKERALKITGLHCISRLELKCEEMLAAKQLCPGIVIGI
jgi:hypothetical protein